MMLAAFIHAHHACYEQADPPVGKKLCHAGISMSESNHAELSGNAAV